ncbi:MAG: EamA family transporter [Clostridiales Family XIII bacterium]|nr:EamA family transporter [Clostridiales Family XIII bacterium]
MWLIFAFASAGFAGITSILAKIGVKNIDSDLATALRTIVVAFFAWLIVFVTGAHTTLAQIDFKNFIFLVLSGLATGGSWLCYFKAIQLGDVNKVTPIDKSSTVLSMLLAFVFLKEPLNAPKAIAMVLIGAGTYLMIARNRAKGGTDAKIPAGAPRDGALSPGRGGNNLWLTFASLSAVFASLTAILGKVGVQDIDSNAGTAIRTVIVLAMVWLLVIIKGAHKEIRAIDGKGGLFLILSGIATGLSWLCYYRALQTGPASIVVPIDKLSILITIAFSGLILKEKLAPKAVCGLLLLVAGTLCLLF